MLGEYITLEEFIKQHNLNPVDHKVGVYDSDEDDDEYPPIVAARCPDCRVMVDSFVEHRCR